MREKVIIFLTYNLSLFAWKKANILEREIYPFINRENIDFIFISYGKKNEIQLLANYDNLDFYNIKKFISKNSFFDRFINPIYSLIFDVGLRKKINNANLILTNQMDGALLPALYAFFFNKKLVLRTGYSLSFFALKLKANFIKILLINIYEFVCILLSTKYTVSSNYEFDYIKDKYPFFSKKLLKVPNWIDTQKFKPEFSNKKLSIVSIGRLEEQKNPFDLILISKLTNLPLTIIGDGYLKKYLYDFIESINAPVRILSKISNDNLPKILNDNTFYLSTSLFEGSPKCILEAMSCGLVTIAYEAPGINELFENKSNGILIKNSPYIAKSIIKELILDKDKIQDISVSARNYIEENNAFIKIIKKQNKVYFEN